MSKQINQNKNSRLPRPAWGALASAAALLLAGCSVTPVKLTDQEVGQRVQNDQQRMYRDQVSVSGPIGFSEAVARALKFNLDYRLKVMESALSRGLLEVAELDLLPKLVADAGYNHRNNDSGGTSIGIEDRVISLRPSTSEERAHHFERATLSWNALDFGLSYYRAKQAADDVNIAEERRRKILQNIVQDVRTAYWRALGAQRLLEEANTLAGRIQDALQKSREAERAGVLAPSQALGYQRALLDAMTIVNVKRQEMQFAKRELAALMSLPPGTEFTLQEEPGARLAPVPLDLDKLETAALTQRPELREEDYKARIGVVEAKRQIAALFPSVNFYAGARYDSNGYLYNSNWAEGGLSLSMNLLRLAGLPAIKRANEAREKTDEARRLALSMAVLTQLRVSVERYRLAVYDEELAAEASRVDQRLASISAAGSSNRLESELEALRTDARALVSRFYLATANAATQAAYGRVLNSVGMDLLPDTVTGTDIPTLATAIRGSLQSAETGAFVQASAAQALRRPVVVRVAEVPAPVGEALVRTAVERVLSRNDISTAADAQALQLSLAFSRAEGARGARAQWTMVVTEPGGRRVLEQRYSSVLPAETTPRAVTALAEAAALSVMGELRRISSVQGGAAAPQ
ncbi:TolC family protein [Azohydromonas australica]|uniref:TolC family protein n=1 Tax=Azohydromonas australica TaxID=364039 RepID=UPI000408EF1F|nr:TolC family protein [Azohydromonas australica]